ncbi:inositol-1-monophosphatase [Bacillaceae bacterium]
MKTWGDHMDAKTKDQLADLAIRCAKEAGTWSLRRMKENVGIRCKTSHADLVTEVDTEVEKLVTKHILHRFPDHGILGEEGTFSGDPAAYETLWIIDPIDGTTNFVHQRLNYVVSIAVYHRGEGMIGVVYDPSRDELFFAVKGQGAFLNGERLRLPDSLSLREALLCTGMFWSPRARQAGMTKLIEALAPECRGIRVLGSAALELAYVAAGRLSGYFSLALNPWDVAAGALIVQEAGGTVSRLTGKRFDGLQKGSILAAQAALHEKLLALAAGTIDGSLLRDGGD